MHKIVYLCIFDILSHFCPIFCHMGQILPLFWHPRNPVIPRVFTFGQKFVTFFQILSPVCHVFVTSINRVVMRFIHKIYINVTNIYKSLTKFFKKNKYIVSNFGNFVTFGAKTFTNVDMTRFSGVTKWGQICDKLK